MADRVVVTGIGLVTPLGIDRATTWKKLINGESGIGQIGAFDAEGYETRIAAEVTDFDAAAAIGRRQARRMDRFTQFACVASLEALEHAGIEMEQEIPERVAVLIGSGVGGSGGSGGSGSRSRSHALVNPVFSSLNQSFLIAGDLAISIPQ